MNVMLQERNDTTQRVSTIYEIKYKVKLLGKCQRQMLYHEADPDNMRIMLAAYEQLSGELNQLCWRIGL